MFLPFLWLAASGPLACADLVQLRRALRRLQSRCNQLVIGQIKGVAHQRLNSILEGLRMPPWGVPFFRSLTIDVCPIDTVAILLFR